MRNPGRRFVAWGAVAIALLAIIVVPTVSSTSSASAANSSDFQPGNIISDDNFYNSGSMSEAQIQGFLASKGANCNGSECLKNYLVDTNSRSADAMCAAYVGAAAEPASRVIAKVSIACGISPEVLLATLEKESSLVDTTTPSEGRYKVAMGYGCPDTAACDSAYYGFFNQIYSAAHQFIRYGNPPGTSNSFTWYPVGKTSNVAFSPNASCGSSPVFIANKATAALYYYTPYQPNSAALGNLYGVGDGCSAYGNRNFWTFYSDWFGSPTGTPYASVDSISAQWGAITTSGWLRGPTPDASEYVWVNVDGSGGPYLAGSALSWFPSYFPGYGPNHGFSITIPASAGTHQVCVYRASTGTTILCSTVTVPVGIGNVDTATPVPGGVRLTGWSLDANRSGIAYIWVNVDGTGQPYATNTTLAWLPTMFSGASPQQGFDVTVTTPPGTHQVCVYGPDELISCQKVTAPYGSGSFDSVTAAPGKAEVKGWYVDYYASQQSYVWVNVDGSGSAKLTNVDLPWLAGYLPGFSTDNGFDYILPMKVGTHSVCVYGASSGALLSCKSVTIPYSAAGNIDTLTGGTGTIELTGWSADLTTSSPGFIWVNVNGTGGAYVASQPLSWFDTLYPGEGPNHGFDVVIHKPAGTYQICVYGSESISLGCQSVHVN